MVISTRQQPSRPDTEGLLRGLLGSRSRSSSDRIRSLHHTHPETPVNQQQLQKLPSSSPSAAEQVSLVAGASERSQARMQLAYLQLTQSGWKWQALQHTKKEHGIGAQYASMPAAPNIRLLRRLGVVHAYLVGQAWVDQRRHV